MDGFIAAMLQARRIALRKSMPELLLQRLPESVRY
jgi:hypothetical protein